MRSKSIWSVHKEAEREKSTKQPLAFTSFPIQWAVELGMLQQEMDKWVLPVPQWVKCKHKTPCLTLTSRLWCSPDTKIISKIISQNVSIRQGHSVTRMDQDKTRLLPKYV